MSEISNLLDELKRIQAGDAWHGPALKETLADVTAAEAAARPAPGAHSIWELVLHIAAWEDVFRRRLEGEPVNEPAEGDFPQVQDQQGWNAAVAKLDAAHAQFIEKISTLTDADLSRIVEGKDYTIAYMLHGVVRHHVYHAGQVGILKRIVRK